MTAGAAEAGTFGLVNPTFEIPGSAQSVSGVKLALPADNALAKSGFDVWKIVVPANSRVAAKGKVLAHQIVNGASDVAESTRAIKIDGVVIDDFAYQQSDSAAISELNSTAADLPVVDVEPGKFIYVEGRGLAGASFEIPGFTQRLAATSVPVAADSPIALSDAEVWKLVIPQAVSTGVQGKIIAHRILSQGDKSSQSPRSISIVGPTNNLPYATVTSYLEGTFVGAIPPDANGECDTGSSSLTYLGWLAQYRVDKLVINDAGTQRIYIRRTIETCDHFIESAPGEHVAIVNQGEPTPTSPGSAQGTVTTSDSHAYVNGSSGFVRMEGENYYYVFTRKPGDPSGCNLQKSESSYLMDFPLANPFDTRLLANGDIVQLAPTGYNVPCDQVPFIQSIKSAALPLVN